MSKQNSPDIIIRCIECQNPFSPMQIEDIFQLKAVICENCGFEFQATAQDIGEILPAKGLEPQKISNSSGYEADNNNRSNTGKTQSIANSINPIHSIIQIDDSHPRVNEKNILKCLTSNWIPLRNLASNLGIIDKREFYILRMKLNEMNRRGLIQMDFQLDRVLIRRA
jgi:DNA-directed RNA polymerase subunit RPC12/RpoP